MTEIIFTQAIHQRQSMSPRLQHACRLLQMPSLEFTQEIARMADSNPFLDLEANEVDGAETHTEGNAEMEVADSYAEDTNLWSETRGKGVQSDSDASALDFIAEENSMRMVLSQELGFLRIDLLTRNLAQNIIDSLDDDGYLRVDLKQLFLGLGYSDVSDEQIEQAIGIVQKLGPAGIAARSLQECLLLQLDTLPSTEERYIAQQVIEKMLMKLSSRDYVGIARELKTTPFTVEKCCNLIRKLDPKPGLSLGDSKVDFITPDIVVKKIRGRWVASLNNKAIPRLKLNSFYAELAHKKRSAASPEFLACLQEAKWTVKNIEHRFSTILAVANAIVERQISFFEYGPMGMKPLGLKEIAEAIGVHESTVSRVTNGKYMTTPMGVFELKHFFSRSMPTASGGACSATALRKLIQEIIAGENTLKPLSDVEIAKNLSRQGLPIARRTVTKYRQSMKIGPAEHRRERTF
jgi:RNA polymerase sigma-54 factor